MSYINPNFIGIYKCFQFALFFGGLLAARTDAQTSLYEIDCGGGAAGTWSADSYYSGGGITNSSVDVNTANVQNPAPVSVYQTQRYGDTTYTIRGLKPAAPYTVRLNIAEAVYNAAQKREFNASINGTQVLTNFDIFAAAGGANIAIVKQFPAAADSSGQIVVYMSAGAVDGPTISGFEVFNPTTSYALTGKITANGAGLAGVTVTVSGSSSGSVTSSSSSGNYSVSLAAGGKFTVTPSLAGYTFSPASASLSNVTANSSQNFTASPVQSGPYQISGYVLLGGSGPSVGSPVSGATITLSGSASATATSGANGYYTFTVNAGGNYTVSASLTHYTLSSSISFSSVTASHQGNFTATFFSGGTLSPASPDKEYIFLNGSVIAVEHPH